MTDAGFPDGGAPPLAEKKHLKPTKTLARLAVLGLVLTVLVLGYLYYRSQAELKKLSTVEGQQALAREEIKAVTDRLSKLTLLPSEEPVIATILDAQVLATQSAFYQQAENGDKLVVYPQAQKAFIYRPSKNVIVNSGPLVVDQNQNSRPVKFEVRNGSNIPGAANRFREQLERSQQEVLAVAEAARKDYQGILVIPVNSVIKSEQLQDFAKSYAAEVRSSLPAGEASSAADILVIVGNTLGNQPPGPGVNASPEL